MPGGGIAWGIYSLRGKGEKNLANATAEISGAPSAFAVVSVNIGAIFADATRPVRWSATPSFPVRLLQVLAVLGGTVVPLDPSAIVSAATVQLSVPVLAAMGAASSC